MPGPWIPDSTLQADLADLLHVDPDDLEACYFRIIPECNKAAAADITLALMARGYSSAQIDGWDQRETYNRDIGLFWAITKGGILRDFPDLNVNKLDRRKELPELMILVSGAAAAPGSLIGGDVIGAMSGRLSDCGNRISMDTYF